MAIAERVHEFEIPARNGRNSERVRLHDSLPRRWIATLKKPTTLPRWSILISHSALIITILAGAIAFGRAASKTEQALSQTQQVPALAASVDVVMKKLDEISQNQAKNADLINKRLDTQQQQINAQAALGTQVNAIQGQMGSVWALAQSDSNKISRLEGMIMAMQNQKKEKE